MGDPPSSETHAGRGSRRSRDDQEPVKQTAERIFRRTLAAMDIPAALERSLARRGPFLRVSREGDTTLDLRTFDRRVAIAFGKAAWPMARALARVLGPDYPPEGILAAPAVPPSPLPGWRCFAGGHPAPNARSFAAGRAILNLLAGCDERTLVFFLLSGGGSSLVELPLDPSVRLEDFRGLHAALVTCGAPIEEINAIRKRLSATKGGRLALAAAASTKVTLAVSDVPPGREDSLASGPTLPDSSTVQDAERIAARWGLAARFPPSLRAAFENHALRETPKEGDPAFAGSHFSVILGQRELMHAAHQAAEAEGFACLCDQATDNWPVAKAAEYLLAQLETQARRNPGRNAAVLADGELSSPVTGNGTGGRNSAFVLACVPRIEGKPMAVLSAGTDGIDGNSPAAGAVADGETFARARAAGLDARDFMARSDAFHYFSRLGDAILTGPTENNLRDLRILLARHSEGG